MRVGDKVVIKCNEWGWGEVGTVSKTYQMSKNYLFIILINNKRGWFTENEVMIIPKDMTPETAKLMIML